MILDTFFRTPIYIEKGERGAVVEGLLRWCPNDYCIKKKEGDYSDGRADVPLG